MSVWITGTIAGLLAGIAGSMGLGGGSVLMLYLTIFAGADQLNAQGINLIFFIPCAITAVILHWRSGLIAKSETLLCASVGLIGAVAGYLLASFIGAGSLRTVFAVYMIALGLRELFGGTQRFRKGNKEDTRSLRVDFK